MASPDIIVAVHILHRNPFVIRPSVLYNSVFLTEVIEMKLVLLDYNLVLNNVSFRQVMETQLGKGTRQSLGRS